MNDLSKAIGKHQNGATINLFVTADAISNVFPTGYNELKKSIEININAPAKDSKVNVKVIKTLSDFFEISYQNVYIISGKQNNKKTVLIKGVSTSNIIKKIEDSIDGL